MSALVSGPALADSPVPDPAPAPPAFEIYLDPTTSILGTASVSLEARIRMREAPSDGLFSYGVTLRFPSELFSPVGELSIEVPAAIDHNGPVPGGALRSVGPGFASVKGTVDVQKPTIEPYFGDLLATVRLAPVDPRQLGSGQLELDFFRTLGSSESIFVTGTGTVLDEGVTFTGGDVVIVPEPGSVALLGVGLAVVGSVSWWVRWRGCHSSAAQDSRCPLSPNLVALRLK